MSSGERAPKPVRRARAWVLLAALALTTIGILMVHSTTADGEDFPSTSARGQILKALVGLVGLVLAARVNYRQIEKHAYSIYFALIAILGGMLVVKAVAGGFNRFINLYVFQVQPSEVMKLGLIVALSRYLRFREDQRRVTGLVGPFLLTLLPMALVLLQPNLGLSLMFPPVLLGMLFVAGAKPRHLLAAVLIVVALIPTAYFLGSDLLHDYQRRRLESFVLRDSSTARNRGYQLEQSLIAVSSGGLTGLGYGQGTQNLLDHLPEKHTDFIFGILCEEMGFAGGVSVVGLYLLLAWGLLRIAVYTREPFGRLTISGIAVAFAAQAFENIGMTLGLTPITGIALPFVSLAGSNLVMSLTLVGVALGIASQPVRVVATRDLSPRDRQRFHRVHDDKAAGQLSSRWAEE